MAGWDRFLTEQDKEVLKSWGKTKLNGFGERPALLIIDALYYSVGTEREPILQSMKKWPLSCGLEGWEAIDKTKELLDVARENEIPVIHARDLEGFPSPWQIWAKREPRRNSLDHLQPEERAKWNQIVDELKPAPGELVVDRPAPSCFLASPLLQHLIYNEIDTLVVCGESTSGCVRATVVDGASNRFRMIVVGEACYDRTESSHFINLFDMHMKYADVIDLEAAKNYFREVGGKKSSAVVPA